MLIMMFTCPYRLPENHRFFQTASQFPECFQTRLPQSHKGTFGTLAIIGGAAGMSGAIVLAASAAMYLGCGKVWAGFNQTALPFAVIPERPEVMLAKADELADKSGISARIIGCGLGLERNSLNLLEKMFIQNENSPLLLDADALTLLAKNPDLHAASQRSIILTPHPAEAARLLNCSTADIQANRKNAAAELAKRFQAVAVLKGCQTLVAHSDGMIYQNASGNAGLATAGSGDVLSGIIGSFLAQGIEPFEAAKAGVWLHGAAADVLKASQIGEIGMLAGEIAPAARWLRNRIAEKFAAPTVLVLQKT